jgi:hypothetical protein
MLANRTSCSALTLTRSVTSIIGLLHTKRTPSAETSTLTDSLYRFRDFGATFLEYGLAGQRSEWFGCNGASEHCRVYGRREDEFRHAITVLQVPS